MHLNRFFKYVFRNIQNGLHFTWKHSIPSKIKKYDFITCCRFLVRIYRGAKKGVPPKMYFKIFGQIFF